jgi:hypothetical protein
MVLSPEIELWPAQIAKTKLKRAYHPIFNRYLLGHENRSLQKPQKGT